MEIAFALNYVDYGVSDHYPRQITSHRLYKWRFYAIYLLVISDSRNTDIMVSSYSTSSSESENKISLEKSLNLGLKSLGLKKSLGISLKKFGLKKVSVSFSKIFGLEKKSL